MKKLTYEIDENFNYPLLTHDIQEFLKKDKPKFNYKRDNSLLDNENRMKENTNTEGEVTQDTYEDIVRKNNELLQSEQMSKKVFNPFLNNLCDSSKPYGFDLCNYDEKKNKSMNDNKGIINEYKGYSYQNKNVFDLPLKHNSDNNIKVIQNNTKGSSYDRVNEQGERKGEQSPDFGRNKSAKDTIEVNDNPSQQIKENTFTNNAQQTIKSNNQKVSHSLPIKETTNTYSKYISPSLPYANTNSQSQNDIMQPLATSIVNPSDPLSNNLISSSLKVTNPYSNQDEQKSIQVQSPNNSMFFQITSLDSISSLPLQEQIRILYKDNQSLQERLKSYQSRYGDINEDEKQNKFKSFLMKENEDMNTLNKKYENIIESFLSFINKINIGLGREQIDISEIKRKSDSVGHLLLPLQSEILMHIKRSIKRRRKGGVYSMTTTENSSEVSDSEDYRPDKYMEKLRNLNSNYDGKIFNYYSPDRVRNCIACDMGLGNSQRPYSPIACSPNRYKYIQYSNN